MKLYQFIASTGDALARCEAQCKDFAIKHRAALRWVERELLPSGSGVDSGTQIVSAGMNKIVLATAYHHMAESGCYDGWTKHEIVIKPNLALGFELRITGRDRNQTKDYLADLYHEALDTEITEAQRKAAYAVD